MRDPAKRDRRSQKLEDSTRLFYGLTIGNAIARDRILAWRHDNPDKVRKYARARAKTREYLKMRRGVPLALVAS